MRKQEQHTQNKTKNCTKTRYHYYIDCDSIIVFELNPNKIVLTLKLKYQCIENKITEKTFNTIKITIPSLFMCQSNKDTNVIHNGTCKDDTN